MSNYMHSVCVVLLFTWGVLGQSSSALNKQWEEWKVKHQKVYNNQSESLYRRKVWEKNLQLVLRHNQEASAGQHTFTMGLNHLADMTAEEVNEKLNGFKMKDPNHFRNWTSKQVSDAPIPSSVDWRKECMVSPVQDQGYCGSCWAFSAVGALEGQMKKKTGSLIPLSPQNLVDCSTNDGNDGCCGGYVTSAYNYIIENGGIDSEQSYPYEEKQAKCRYTSEGKAGECFGFQVLPEGDENILQYIVATVGPISAAVNANLRTLHFYEGGVYNDPECDNYILNHAILIVGYGTDQGEDFWLVKNSWGTGWGEAGYLRLARNSNLCGIADDAIYPEVNCL
ncbi:cathepsin L1-like [Myripristis murdjan]|uniref:cathepsin L1-like n=1 Tax=Myripristis murdjan TaxID=586833 RepID=UPI00117610AF|nr:cathepsin L1-like [Myripristis murdjan]